MGIELKWTNYFGITDAEIAQWRRQLGPGEDLLFWALRSGKLDDAQYLQWATDEYGIPVLRNQFFTAAPDQELWQKLRTAYTWGPSLFPVSAWDGVIYVACLQPPTHPAPPKNCVFVLAASRNLGEYWKKLNPQTAQHAPEVAAGLITFDDEPFAGELNGDDSESLPESEFANDGSAGLSEPPQGISLNDDHSVYLQDLNFDLAMPNESLAEPSGAPPLHSEPDEDETSFAELELSLDQPKSTEKTGTAAPLEPPTPQPKMTTPPTPPPLPKAPPVPPPARAAAIRPESRPATVPVPPPPKRGEFTAATGIAIPVPPPPPNITPPPLPPLPPLPSLEELEKATENEAESEFNLSHDDDDDEPTVATPIEFTMSSIVNSAGPTDSPMASSTIFGKTLSFARNYDELGKLTIAHILKVYDHGVIFVFQNGHLKPWKWSDALTTTPGAASTLIDLSSPSIFRIVSQTRLPYHGYVVANDINNKFFANFHQGLLPKHVTIIPILIDNQIGGMLMGISNGDISFKSSLVTMETLGSEVATQFARLRQSKAKSAA